MDDEDAKHQSLMHLVLGNREYVRIKASTKPLVGRRDGEPVAEKTKFGWVIMSPGIDSGIEHDVLDTDAAIRCRESLKVRRSRVSRFYGKRPEHCV